MNSLELRSVHSYRRVSECVHRTKKARTHLVFVIVVKFDAAFLSSEPDAWNRGGDVGAVDR